MILHPLVIEARDFATWAHAQAGNTRNFVGGPYICHPAEVAEFVSRFTDDPVAIAAAWLHDVIEDAGRTKAELVDRFGAEVGETVWCLSDDPSIKHLPRAQRLEVNVARLADAPGRVHLVKACDIWSNGRNIAELNPRFARIYLPEKARVLTVLTRAPAELLNEVWSVVTEGAHSLGLELSIAQYA